MGSSAFAAAPPKIDVQNATITCNTVIATASLKPSLVNGGTSPTQIKVKGTLNGCTVSGAASPVTILSGSFSGTLAGSSNGCAALLGSNPAPGTLTLKWKADKTTPIVQTSSVVTVTTITGSLFAAPWTANYGEFSLASSSVTGAFTGGDGGAGSSTTAVTSQDLGAILAGCATTTGVKTLNIGLGQIKLS